MWSQKIESYLYRSYLLLLANLGKMYKLLNVFPTITSVKGECSAEQKLQDKYFTPFQLLQRWLSRVVLLSTSSQLYNVAEILAESLYLIKCLQYLDLAQTSDFPKALSWKNGARQAGLTFPGSGSQASGECWRFGHRVFWRFNPQCPRRPLSAAAVWCKAEPLPHVCVCIIWDGVMCRFWTGGQVGADPEHFNRFPGGANAAHRPQLELQEWGSVEELGASPPPHAWKSGLLSTKPGGRGWLGPSTRLFDFHKPGFLTCKWEWQYSLLRHDSENQLRYYVKPKSQRMRNRRHLIHTKILPRLWKERMRLISREDGQNNTTS